MARPLTREEIENVRRLANLADHEADIKQCVDDGGIFDERWLDDDEWLTRDEEFQRDWRQEDFYDIHRYGGYKR